MAPQLAGGDRSRTATTTTKNISHHHSTSTNTIRQRKGSTTSTNITIHDKRMMNSKKTRNKKHYDKKRKDYQNNTEVDDDDDEIYTIVDTKQKQQQQSSFYQNVIVMLSFVLVITIAIAVSIHLIYVEEGIGNEERHPSSSTRATTSTTTTTKTSSSSSSSYVVLQNNNVTSDTRTKRGTYKLLETIPHDTKAFTQGLITVYDGNTSTYRFYEGTGSYGESELRLVTIPKNGSTIPGTIVASYQLPYEYFGEGITAYRVNDSSTNDIQLIQLTWLNQVALEYVIQKSSSSNNKTNTSTISQSPVVSPTTYIPPTFIERLHILIQSTRFCRVGLGRRLRFCQFNTGSVQSDTTETNNTTTVRSSRTVNTNPYVVNPPISTLSFTTTNNQGWGITYSKLSNVFYVTDGSNYIHVWDGTTKQEIQKIEVTYQYSDMSVPQSLMRLNEIEYDPYTNTILSNIWFKNEIIRIDVETGFVLTIYDFTDLYPTNQRSSTADSFNGIALTYDTLIIQEEILASSSGGNGISSTSNVHTDQIWVTGKYWPKLYRVQLI